MTAVLDGIPMRLNPQSVSWTYSIKMADVKTIGGKVIQIYGVSLGDLVIEGSFGAGGVAEQRAFFDRITAIIESQMPTSANADPVHFYWPERGWDFWCFVKAISQPGGNAAIDIRNDIVAPGYRLTMFIQEDNGDLVRTVKSAAQAAFIGRLSAGLGWKHSDWSGPGYSELAPGGGGIDEAFAEYQETLGGQTIMDRIFEPISDLFDGAL